MVMVHSTILMDKFECFEKTHTMRVIGTQKKLQGTFLDLEIKHRWNNPARVSILQARRARMRFVRIQSCILHRHEKLCRN